MVADIITQTILNFKKITTSVPSHLFWKNKSEIVRFLQDEPVINAKRLISDVWGFTDDELEKHHDYIQWVFPLKEKSAFNSDAPVLTDEMVEEIKNCPICIESIQESAVIFLRFLGWEIIDVPADENGPSGKDIRRIKLGDKQKKMEWVDRSHNYLRITRIMTSLNLFGLHELSSLFFLVMCRVYDEYYNKIGKKTFKLWLLTQDYFIPKEIINSYEPKYISDLKSYKESEEYNWVDWNEFKYY